MKLFEYQGKEIFGRYKIPVPKSRLADFKSIETALRSTNYPCVLKSQVLRGGRGKAGLIRVVNNEEEAKGEARRLFDIGINKLLIEEAVDIERELYLSITVEPVEGKALLIASAEGGMEIETLARDFPEKIIREKVDLNTGIMPFQARDVSYKLTEDTQIASQIASIILRLYAVFRDYDAELVEINPLFVSKSGSVIAGDAKLIIDDNSRYKHPEYQLTREHFESDAEYEAAMEGIPYLQFDGDISLMCAGAGLTTTVFDLIHYEGGTVANYLEFGGPNYRKAKRAMELCLKNESKVILIVTFGTIARADVMAKGVVEAIEALKPDRPIVTCIRGTNEEEAVKILKGANLTPIFDTEEAVREAVRIAKGVTA